MLTGHKFKVQICTELDLNTWWLRVCQWRQQWDKLLACGSLVLTLLPV